MNYVKIYPYFLSGRFNARIKKDNIGNIDFDIPNITFEVLARKNDGSLVSKKFIYPNDVVDENYILIDLLPLYKTEYAQILSVRVNDVKIGVSYSEHPSIEGFSFRYDDSVLVYPDGIIDDDQPILDFQIIDTNDSKSLLIEDTSRWGLLENIDATISILLPNENNPIIHYFIKHRANNLNSIDLGITHVDLEQNSVYLEDLPDGVYQITLNSSAGGLYVERYYLRSTLLRYKIDKMYIHCAMDCLDYNENIIKNINKIEIYLEAANAFMRAGDFNSAYMYYTEADKLSKKCKC